MGALGILMVWAAFWVVPRLEGRLESAVSEALSQRGFQVSSITATGTTITVVGGPDAPDARLALAAAVRNVPGVSGVRSLLLTEEGSPPAAATRLAEADSRPGTVESPGPGAGVPPGSSEGGGEAPVEGEDTPSTAAPEEAGEVSEWEQEASGDLEASRRPDPIDGTAPPVSAQTSRGDSDLPEATPESSSPSPTPPAVSTAPPETERSAPCRVRLMRVAEGRTLVYNEGSSALSEADQAVLSEVALALRSCGEWTLTIVGFASASEGRDAWLLADRRAYGAARFLLDRGIDESRIATVSGNTPSDEEGSPRVELFVSGGE